MRYAIVIENAGANYSVYVPDLPDCVATPIHIEGMRANDSPVPSPSSRVDYVEVAA